LAVQISHLSCAPFLNPSLECFGPSPALSFVGDKDPRETAFSESRPRSCPVLFSCMSSVSLPHGLCRSLPALSVAGHAVLAVVTVESQRSCPWINGTGTRISIFCLLHPPSIGSRASLAMPLSTSTVKSGAILSSRSGGGRPLGALLDLPDCPLIIEDSSDTAHGTHGTDGRSIFFSDLFFYYYEAYSVLHVFGHCAVTAAY
jgi:hypothetical protein